MQAHPRRWTHRLSLWVGGVLGVCVGCAYAQVTMEPARAKELVRMVRQDCGSCHGMRLTGGLGPALTPAALQHIPVTSLSATIFHGRAGTPMPPWRAMISSDEAEWIAQQLLAGFPTEEASKP